MLRFQIPLVLIRGDNAWLRSSELFKLMSKHQGLAGADSDRQLHAGDTFDPRWPSYTENVFFRANLLACCPPQRHTWEGGGPDWVCALIPLERTRPRQQIAPHSTTSGAFWAEGGRAAFLRG